MQGKNSFILYTDLLHTAKKMTAEQRGDLFLLILEYVNDLNPEPNSTLLELVFEPIKQQFKRDLVKWNNVGTVKSEAGKLGGIKSGEARRLKKEANEAYALKHEANEANEHVLVNVPVSVNVPVNVSESKITNFTPENLKSFFCQDIKTKAQEHRCKALKVTLAKLIELENDFIEIKTAATEFWPTQKEAVGNFINWALIQLKKQNGKHQQSNNNGFAEHITQGKRAGKF